MALCGSGVQESLDHGPTGFDLDCLTGMRLSLLCLDKRNAMPRLFATQARLPDGWHRDVLIDITDGRITGLTPDADPGDADLR